MLTEAQITQFKQDGFLVIPDFFKPSHTERLVAAWQQVKQELQAKTGRYQRADRFVIGKLPQVLDKLYETERLVQAAGNLLGNDNIAVYLSNFLLKDESWDGQVHNHQDMPYTNGSQQKVITFIPLEPQNEENGGLKILKGTHKYGNIGIRGTIRAEDFPATETACPSLGVGDVLFVDALTWHYSEQSKVQKARPMRQIMYQPATDGSYSGLEEPTLVAGEWQTQHFLPYGFGITSDMLSTEAAHQQEVAQLTEQLRQAQLQLERSQTQLKDLKHQLQAMESSKFWQLRSRWFELKRSIGLKAQG